MRWFVSTVIIFALSSSFASAQEGAYAKTAAMAFSERKPLVVFIGIQKRPIEGAITMQVQSLEGYDNKSIVVSKPGDEWLVWSATLPADASDAQLANALGFNQGGAVDALDEVNAVRAARGLAPFAKDDGLTQGAMSAARFRADRRMSGHTPNDFAHLPGGAFASGAGCAAWPTGMGWGSCCTYENWRFAGAAYVIGSDGQRYMQLFVRN